MPAKTQGMVNLKGSKRWRKRRKKEERRELSTRRCDDFITDLGSCFNLIFKSLGFWGFGVGIK